MSELLTETGKFKVKASSTLQSSFGAKNMFDGSLDTCWNSGQGSPQSITVDFLKPVEIHSLRIAFQGGFAGQDCAIEIGDDLDTMTLAEKWETIRDTNDLQARTLPSPTTGRFLKLTFEAATDFYGRITIYSLEVFGSQV